MSFLRRICRAFRQMGFLSQVRLYRWLPDTMSLLPTAKALLIPSHRQRPKIARYGSSSERAVRIECLSRHERSPSECSTYALLGSPLLTDAVLSKPSAPPAERAFGGSDESESHSPSPPYEAIPAQRTTAMLVGQLCPAFLPRNEPPSCPASRPVDAFDLPRLNVETSYARPQQSLQARSQPSTNTLPFRPASSVLVRLGYFLSTSKVILMFVYRFRRPRSTDSSKHHFPCPCRHFFRRI